MPLTIRAQLRRHAVALISLVVAITSLAYNTWRNEQSEYNRNIRAAGFQLLVKLGELDRVVFFAHFERDTERGNQRLGWSYVLTIRDLTRLMPEPLPASGDALHAVWSAKEASLGAEDDDAQRAIDAAIETLREQVLESMRRLH